MSNNRIRVVGTFQDNISREVARVRDSFDRFGKSKGASMLLQGVGLGAGVSAWNAVGRAVTGAVDFMGEAIGAASDLRESMALSQQVFEGNTDAVKQWGETAAEAFGMSQREALNFAASFGTAFKSVGVSLDEATEKSEALTRLAADLGSAFNASSQEAATALRSGLIGESEPMRRFGVFLSEAAVQAKAVALGIADVGDKLTDTQKVAARYAIIMEQTADSQGMFGRDTGSLADAQKSLAAEFENLQAEVGTGLLPIMVSFAKALNDDVIPALKDMMGAMGHLGWAMEYQRDNTEKLMFWQRGLLGMWTDGAQSAEAYAKAMEKAAYQVSDAAMEGAEAWDTYSEKAGMARDASGAWVKPAKDAAAALIEVGRAASGSAATIEDVRKAWQDLDDTLESRRRLEDMPDLVRVAAAETKTAYADLQAAIKKGDNVAIAAARLRYREARREVADLRTEWTRLRAEFAKGINIGQIFGSINRPGQPNRAVGGPVESGQAYIVGEKGRELFVPKTDGTIIPNHELIPQTSGTVVPNNELMQVGAPPAAAPANVAVAVYLDSDQIAARVERRQYFAASVAPVSAR